MPVAHRHALIVPVPSLLQQSRDAGQVARPRRGPLLLAYNNSPPICNLPVEVIQMIFANSYESNHNSLITLSHVCRRFRAMVLSMPRRFWTKVDARVLSRAEAFIERAGGIPVDMTFILDNAPQGHDLLSGFLNLFSVQHSHIRALDLRLPYNDMKNAIEALIGCFSRLEVLKLSVEKDSVVMSCLDTPLPLKMPANSRLKEAYLRHCSLEWTWSEGQERHTDLRVLWTEGHSLCKCHPPAMTEFLDLLAASPMLTELVLDHAGPLVQLGSQQHLDRTVSLPNLDILTLSNLPEDIHCILSQIVLPSDTMVVCHYMLSADNAIDISGLCLSHPQNLQVLPHITDIVYTMNSTRNTFETSVYTRNVPSLYPPQDADPSLQLKLHGCDLDLSSLKIGVICTHMMTEFFRDHSSATTMHIRWDLLELNDDDWQMILHHALNVTHLHVTSLRDTRMDDDVDCDDLFCALLAVGDNHELGVAPKLTTLSLWGWKIDLDLASLISEYLKGREEGGLPLKLEIYHRSENEGIRAEDWAAVWQSSGEPPRPVILPQEDSADVEQYYIDNYSGNFYYDKSPRNMDALSPDVVFVYVTGPTGTDIGSKNSTYIDSYFALWLRADSLDIHIVVRRYLPFSTTT
ncbi:hypothetical protein K474DRAFT_1673571 [Panus rudis PR-1116 ss-1]|nr:hypothetical protein K474DRAFT_1673571 [Panus rudis PR-1116 ss-1]